MVVESSASSLLLSINDQKPLTMNAAVSMYGDWPTTTTSCVVRKCASRSIAAHSFSERDVPAGSEGLRGSMSTQGAQHTQPAR